MTHQDGLLQRQTSVLVVGLTRRVQALEPFLLPCRCSSSSSTRMATLAQTMRAAAPALRLASQPQTMRRSFRNRNKGELVRLEQQQRRGGL